MSKPHPEISTPIAKPALVLVHGFRGAPVGLSAIAQELRAQGYQVFVPAIPPFAGTKALAEYTPEAYADYLATYIREQELARPILIGHSMGSVICAATAKKYPKLVNKKLILLSPIAGKTNRFFASIAPLSALLPRRLVDYITTKYLFVPNNRDLWRATLAITHACTAEQPPKRRAAIAAATCAAKYTVEDALPTGNQAVLLLAGVKDRLVPQKRTRQLAKILNAEIVFLDGAGHLHNYEKPKETAAAILKFLSC